MPCIAMVCEKLSRALVGNVPANSVPHLGCFCRSLVYFRPAKFRLAQHRNARDLAFMTLFIQRAEHRDTQAMHAKLDEILRALDQADSRLTNIDKLQPEEIERQRDRTRNTR